MTRSDSPAPVERDPPLTDADLVSLRALAARWAQWWDVRVSTDFALRELAQGTLVLIAEIERLRTAQKDAR